MSETLYNSFSFIRLIIDRFYVLSIWRHYSNLIEISPDGRADGELFSSSSPSAASAASYSSTPGTATLASLLLTSSRLSTKSGASYSSSSSAPTKISNLAKSH